jgi:hypothetical protein
MGSLAGQAKPAEIRFAAFGRRWFHEAMSRGQDESEATAVPAWQFRTGSRSLQAALIAAILLGVFLILHAFYESRRHRASHFWPSTTGTIVSCESRFQGGRQSHWGVEATYTYEAAGAPRVSHQISLWNPGLEGDRADAIAFVRAHPSNSTVPVYYDPVHPEIATLIPGADEQGHEFSIVCGTFIMAAGIWCLFRVREGGGRVRKPGWT